MSSSRSSAPPSSTSSPISSSTSVSSALGAAKGKPCSKETPCRKPFVCGPESKTCVSRGSREAKKAVKDAFKKTIPRPVTQSKKKRQQTPAGNAVAGKEDTGNDSADSTTATNSSASPPLNPVQDPVPMDVEEPPQRVWDSTRKQGSIGFNAYCNERMRAAGLVFTGSDLQCPRPGKLLQPSPPQQVVQFLVHPQTTVERLLVAHRTGLGKTYSMILALDNFYDDPRAKAVIFPNNEVANNFYEEIMKFPNRYRDFVRAETGRDTVKDVQRVVDVLALKGLHLQSMAGKVHPKNPAIRYPAAPLRAERYTRAGGSTVLGTKNAPTTWPRPDNMLFRWRAGKKWDGRNPYSNMIVIMDEFHNLWKPDAEVLAFSGNKERLARMRHALRLATNSVIVGLTATPVIDDPADARAIVDILKGEQYKNATDEGFVSYFQALPETVFATVTTGKPPQALPKLVKVPLAEEDVQLQIYLKKLKQSKASDETKKMRSLLPLMSSGIYAGQGFDTPSQNGYKRLRAERDSVAVKLTRVVRDVMKNPKKTLILVHSAAGFKQLRAIWEIEARDRQGMKCPGVCWIAHGQYKNKKQKAPIDRERDAFNDPATNANGEKIQVIIADAKFYEAGVSFKQVRRLILVDVPTTWASYMQRIGRVLRFCGHDVLPKNQRTVELLLYVCTSPIVEKTPDEYFVEKIEKDNAIMIKALEDLHRTAVDYPVLLPFHHASSAYHLQGAPPAFRSLFASFRTTDDDGDAIMNTQ